MLGTGLIYGNFEFKLILVYRGIQRAQMLGRAQRRSEIRVSRPSYLMRIASA